MSEIPVYKFQPKAENTFPFEIIRLENNPRLAHFSQKPRRDRFYALFWVTGGNGHYKIDFQDYALKANTLFLVAPGQVHYWESSVPVSGYAIPFQDELFHTLGGSDFLGKLDLFDMLGGAFVVNFPVDEALQFDAIFNQLFSEYQSHQFGRTEMIVSLLKIVLIGAQRRFVTTDGGLPTSAGQQLVRQYLSLLQGDVTAEHRLETFAGQLGVTPGHLTEMVKEVTGVAAGTLLRQRLILETKRLLIHTNLTSAQVAEKLMFKDPAYFNRFFKRETGQTPREFRDEFHRTG